MKLAVAAMAALLALPATAAPDPSFLKGLVDGCTDTQKRLHNKQGIPFNAPAVREYCHCEAANMADAFPTPAERNKLRDRDAAAIARVKEISITCVQAIKAGRRFAPR